MIIIIKYYYNKSGNLLKENLCQLVVVAHKLKKNDIAKDLTLMNQSQHDALHSDFLPI